jgi:hypothetical protein
MKTNDQGASIPQTGEANSLPTGSRPVQPSGRVHRQYRYYCNHPPILSHYTGSIFIIDPSAFGLVFNSHIQSYLLGFVGLLSLNPLVVFPFHLHSSNPDACRYCGGRGDVAFLYPPIPLGAFGPEVDSRVDALRPCPFNDAMFDALEICRLLFTRCGDLGSSFVQFALILFTRCSKIASQAGRFA